MKPMMAQPIEIVDLEKKAAGFVMEPKLDGMRLLLHFPAGKLSEALTRSGRDVLPQVPAAWRHATMDVFRQFYVETGFEWLDCEFGYMNGFLIDFNKTMRVMGSKPDEAQRKALEHHDLPYAHVFDIPEASELSLWARRCILERDTNAFTIDDPDFPEDELDHPNIGLVPQHDKFDQSWYEWYVKDGGEGVMLKDPNGVYETGKRPSRNWYKLKKFATLDAYIVGFDPGEGKFEGLIGAIVWTTIEGQIGKCSGMDDATRLWMSARQDRLIRDRQVIEVKYFGLTAGTPRHPQFLRMRDDKPWYECSWRAS
jgi:ATP-dependent DNA ligase